MAANATPENAITALIENIPAFAEMPGISASIISSARFLMLSYCRSILLRFFISSVNDISHFLSELSDRPVIIGFNG